MNRKTESKSRREFIKSIGISAFTLSVTAKTVNAANQNRLIKPRSLRPNDMVGLITPATEVLDPDRLTLAEQTLKYFGLQVKLGKNVGKGTISYRASVQDRLDDLHNMFRDPEVRGVFAIRGGYGSPHLLDRIDYNLIRRNPKIFMGYSDITALHLAINKYSRLVTFHGPVVLSRFTNYTQQHFRKALFEKQPLGKLTNPLESNEIRPTHTLRTVKPGVATGQLTGGNLSLICSMIGTPYEIETRGKILFLEEVREPPYRIDRMLTQLRLAGKFKQVAGIVWGECQDCGSNDYNPQAASPFTTGQVIDNILGELKVPVLSGLTIGHTTDQLTLPMGITATLNATKGILEIKESAVT